MDGEIKSLSNMTINRVNHSENPNNAPCSESSDVIPDGWKKRNIIKNFVVISIVSSLYLTGCNTVQKLQSSINLENGLGTASLAVQSATNMLGGIFLVTYTVRNIGPKNTILLSAFITTLYVASNFYASWYTLMPSSAIVGLAYCCVYTAFYTYVSHLSSYYSILTGVPRPLVVSRFFGIFFMALQTNGVIGGIVGYYALLVPDSNATQMSPNASDHGGRDALACGAEFCDYLVDAKEAVSFTAPKEQIYLLWGILVALTVAAFLVAWIFLDKMGENTEEKESLCQALRLIARRQKNIFHILLIPITTYSGLQLSFITSDFTKAYITCSSSVEYIGFVLITYSVSDTIASLLLGHLVQLIGRIGVFLLAATVDVSMILTMLLWTPNSEQKHVLFIIAGIWGIGDGVWQAQVKALYGSLFPDYKEPAFSLQGAWECFGITVGFAYSSAFCTKYTIYILMVVLVLGIICYLVAEYLIYKRERLHGK